MLLRNGTDWLDHRLSVHEAPTPKADAADRANDCARRHYGFGGLDLLRPLGLVALLAELIRKTSRLTGFRTPEASCHQSRSASSTAVARAKGRLPRSAVR